MFSNLFQINRSLTREKYPLSRKKITKKTVASLINLTVPFIFICFIFSLITISISSDANIDFPVVFNFILVIISLFSFIYLIVGILIYFYQKAYFAKYYYEFNNDYIIIKKGVFNPIEITIPWEKIQDVYVEQDLFDYFLGLYDVYISTPTIISGYNAHIDGVEKEGAEGLKEEILKRIKEKSNFNNLENKK